MNRYHKLALRSARWLALAFAVLVLPPSDARAQFYGYGGYGGYGYGYPGYGGYGGYGYPGPGYGGFGYGYGFNPYLSQFYTVGPSVPGYGYGSAYMSPLYGAGLTPLGVESALIETSIIRGSGGYRLRYPATVTAPVVVPGRYGVYRP